ncbi:MAG: histone deacetylase family protein [Gammaproteobacteria bacterium]|nr:histone deacetylase family protein [Gammaproteobacteria bacterium]
MFRIRRIFDDTTPANRELLAQVQAILRVQFPGLGERSVDKLPEQLRNPLKFRFRAILFVAEDGKARVQGFALLSHEPVLHFTYLDYISTGRRRSGGGIGSALYERVREESRRLRARGLFFECLPDDPGLSPDPTVRAQNASRLRFYERYGALPIIGTAYETPVAPTGTDPPYLVYDSLGRGSLKRADARRIVRAVLEGKYGTGLPDGYVDRVVRSFRDDPVRLREPLYVKRAVRTGPATVPRERRIALTVNRKHSIHHVQDTGYVQAPVRIRSILTELDKTALFERIKVRHFADRHIKAVHDSKFVEFLKRACANVPPGRSVYPYVFPVRNQARPPKELPLRAGYYCIDTFTPLNQNAYLAALGAVDCALTSAECLLEGYPYAYALVRPPGHHAERSSFGGFCYFNSAAIAAHFLSEYGKVALLDIDYHHGNGTQDIFYERADVLTLSIHGHPRYTYPYFSGYEEEKGTGAGKGMNVNMPLPENIDGARFRQQLGKALERIRRFAPQLLVVSLGLDTARGDPTGSWTLTARDFRKNGSLVGGMGLPTLVVQEGGYRTRTLGVNARNFFVGFWQGAHDEKTRALPRQNASAHAARKN